MISRFIDNLLYWFVVSIPAWIAAGMIASIVYWISASVWVPAIVTVLTLVGSWEWGWKKAKDSHGISLFIAFVMAVFVIVISWIVWWIMS